MEQWNQIFTAVILPLLTALMGLLIAWLNAKRVELGAKSISAYNDKGEKICSIPLGKMVQPTGIKRYSCRPYPQARLLFYDEKLHIKQFATGK